MMAKLRHVSKAFGHLQVLRDVTLEVQDKEIFGLIGPSGAGKTTLIRLLIGALGADAGEIEIAGRRIPDLAALRQIGYMPQSDALYADLTGLENLRFFGGLYGLRGAALHRRCREVLDFVDLGQAAGQRVAQYSGGMRKRLSLAVALIHAPALLILDEPTVGIDPVLRRRIWEGFRSLLAQGRTLIVSTHVMDEADRCDRLALVYGGGILACGTVGELKARAGGDLENLFLGEDEEQ